MTKVCSKCKQLKSIKDFGKNKAMKDGFAHYCKKCAKEHNKNQYITNLQNIKQSVRNYGLIIRKENRIKMIDYLLIHPCVDCGNKDIRVLEFDHIYDKKVEVSRLLSCQYVWSRILKEIEKCEVVCANCHKIRTANRLNNYRNIHHATMLELQKVSSNSSSSL